MIPISEETRRRNLTTRRDVRMALEAGFEIDEVLWMLDLVEPLPSAMVNGVNLALPQSGRLQPSRMPVRPRRLASGLRRGESWAA